MPLFVFRVSFQCDTVLLVTMRRPLKLVPGAALVVWTILCGARTARATSCSETKDSCDSGSFASPDPAAPYATAPNTNAQNHPDEVAELTKVLVSIPSVSGSEHDAGHYIASWLRRRNWDVTLQPVEEVTKEAPRFNVVALPKGTSAKDTRVVLSTHFDTVPSRAYDVSVRDGRLYGRGSTDAKGIVAAIMVAGTNITALDRAPVALLFVCGEETDHAGMKAANAFGFPRDVTIINGEPTLGRICTKQKGMLKVELTATGTSCHSGYPELGSSAIVSLLDALSTLRGMEWPVDSESGARTTLNIGTISGGSAGRFSSIGPTRALAGACDT